MATIEPITDRDITDVVTYLAKAFEVDPRGPEQKLRWATERGFDNLGYLLRHDGAVVGAFLATYGDTAAGQTICHLDWWHVSEDFRHLSIPLFRAILTQNVDAFTDYTPQPHVRSINRRLGFRELDTRAIRMWNLRIPGPRRGVRIVNDPEEIAQLLSGRELRLFDDHREVPGVGHLVIQSPNGNCVMTYRRVDGRTTRTRILYVSDPAVFRAFASRVLLHLALTHRSLFTVAELRVLGGTVRGTRSAPSVWRQYRSETVPESALGELYSPLVWSR